MTQRRTHRMTIRAAVLCVMALNAGCTQRDASQMARATPPVIVDSSSPFSDDGRLMVQRQIPAFRVATLTGDSIAVGGAATGTLTLVNLWDTRCGPCKIEFPALQRLHETYGPRGLRIVAISNDQSDAAVRAFIMQTGATFPIGRDPENLILRRLRDRGLPQHALVSANGTILWERLGAVASGGSDPDMTRAIESALGSQ